MNHRDLDNRPDLPERYANRHLKQLDTASLPPVKYQVLTSQGKEILVGRMKIATETGNGHAFILRRFDTGAISLTTMFRAAFPDAPDNDEKRETTWVKENYDLAGNNGSSKEHTIVRLAGTWVSPDIALELADSYNLGSIISTMTQAVPDPNTAYRRSGKGTSGTPKESPVAPAGSKTSSPAVFPSATKRRKESSPLIESEPPVPARRSARPRSKSPSASTALSPLSPVKKPSKTSKPKNVSTSESRMVFAKFVTEIPGVESEEDTETAHRIGDDMFREDVAEQRHLIAGLKSRREGVNDGSMSKRARDEQEVPTQLNLKEPEVGERAIATNKRVGRFHLEPRQKSFAWGVAAFAFGLGAVTFLPSLM